MTPETGLPAIVMVHMTAAIAATALGPFVMWARLGARLRPNLHRSAGYVWVALMVATAISAIFVRSTLAISWAGFSPIHLFVPFVFFNLAVAFRALFKGRIATHRRHMVYTYVGACLVAGLFTLVPGRYLGDLLWGALSMRGVAN